MFPIETPPQLLITSNTCPSLCFTYRQNPTIVPQLIRYLTELPYYPFLIDLLTFVDRVHKPYKEHLKVLTVSIYQIQTWISLRQLERKTGLCFDE